MDYEKEYNRVCNEYIPRVQELEEENKKLREELEWYKEQYWEDIDTEIVEFVANW